MSAWCLGILNSHRKFFLSYSASVAWNVAMIATLIGFGRLERTALAVKLAWGSVAGSVLVFAVQLPFVLRLARHMRFRPDTDDPNVREVVRNFVPVFIGRGVVTDQRLYRYAAFDPAAQRRHHRVYSMRRPFTCCRSACSACRYPRLNCPQCPARLARRPKSPPISASV